MTMLQTASALLDRSEKEQDLTLKLNFFSEAIGLLDSVARQPHLSPADADTMRNLRLVHTRTLLSTIPDISDYAKLDDWLAVQWVFKKIQPEIEMVTREDRDLKALHEAFLSIWQKQYLGPAGKKRPAS